MFGGLKICPTCKAVLVNQSICKKCSVDAGDPVNKQEVLDILTGKPLYKFKIYRKFEGYQKEIECIAKNDATFGHHTELPDMQILVEPILEMTMEDPNLQKSLRISRRHFSLLIEDKKAYYVELSSGNGTSRRGKRLQLHQKLEIQGLEALNIAGVLDIDVERVDDETGNPSSIVIHRNNSNPNKIHAMIHHKIGLWPLTSKFVSHVKKGRVMAPACLFINETSHVCFMNLSSQDCRIEAVNVNKKLSPNESVVLKGKDIVIYIDSEILVLE